MCNLYKGLFEKVSICYVTFGYTEAFSCCGVAAFNKQPKLPVHRRMSWWSGNLHSLVEFAPIGLRQQHDINAKSCCSNRVRAWAWAVLLRSVAQSLAQSNASSNADGPPANRKTSTQFKSCWSWRITVQRDKHLGRSTWLLVLLSTGAFRRMILASWTAVGAAVLERRSKLQRLEGRTCCKIIPGFRLNESSWAKSSESLMCSTDQTFRWTSAQSTEWPRRTASTRSRIEDGSPAHEKVGPLPVG